MTIAMDDLFLLAFGSTFLVVGVAGVFATRQVWRAKLGVRMTAMMSLISAGALYLGWNLLSNGLPKVFG